MAVGQTTYQPFLWMVPALVYIYIYILGQELLTPPPGMAAKVFVCLPCSPVIQMFEFPFGEARGANSFLYFTPTEICSPYC